MRNSKYYVVWIGKSPGIYNNWEECKKQVEGEKNARYKAYPTLEEAVEAFRLPPPAPVRSKIPDKNIPKPAVNSGSGPVWESISVDAACSGNPGKVEYQGVNTATGKVLFRQGPFEEGTNNIGEFLAIVHALSAMKREGSSLPVYSDSLTARKWVRDKAVKTKLQPTPKNRILFDMIERALKWLQENEYPNKILVWDTANWGEIPADFGRK
ncbi:MAG: viroplasmin family protein [Bacteroidales bacterium]